MNQSERALSQFRGILRVCVLQQRQLIIMRTGDPDLKTCLFTVAEIHPP